MIEEYPIILRNCVWFRPPQLPVIIDRVERVMRAQVLIDG
ncbi:Uncharacterised protein [Chlamydia abortus]|nr:Uncharacterised protein [Chlamydia abortus]